MSRGQPKKFKNEKQLIDLFSQFCDNIEKNHYANIPSQTNFCKWLADNYVDVDRRTIYNSLNKYFPNIKKEFEQMQGDLLAQGAMLGKWKETSTIFALKNWCKWTDKAEPQIKVAEQTNQSFMDALNEKASEVWEDEKQEE